MKDKILKVLKIIGRAFMKILKIFSGEEKN